jgi:SH3 domain protein
MQFNKLNLTMLLLGVIATSNTALAISSTDSEIAVISKPIYVTDQFEVTMRSGTSTTNEILMLLKSGQELTLLEQDPVTQYSLVKTASGKQGYVLTRFLVDIPSARQRLTALQQSTATMKQENISLQAKVSNLEADLENQLAENDNLKTTLLTTDKELDRVSIAAENTLDIVDKNMVMEATITELQIQQSLLVDENLELKDSTKIDWFLRGAAVALIAFLIGILVTRIRWKKQDSWGAY